jgi:hypothetical protein
MTDERPGKKGMLYDFDEPRVDELLARIERKELSADALAAIALRDPLCFIELCVAVGGHARDKALAMLKGGFTHIEAHLGKSIWEHGLPLFAKRVRQERRKGRTWHDTPFHVHFPYCFRPVGDGLYLPVGREYGPVGHPQDHSHSDYAAYAPEAWSFSCDPYALEGVWLAMPLGKYLYDGHFLHTVKEFEDYLRRLGRLIAASDHPMLYASRLLRTLPPQPARKGKR